MTTLIAVYTSDGCVGRCDAKCYEAEHAECSCICGGSNHGKGRVKAMENTREHLVRRLESLGQVELAQELAQLDLFEDG